MIEKQFDILEKTRKLIIKIVDNLTIDQINKIPSGFNNNVAWNFAHLIVTQQLLCNRFSGLDCYVDEEAINSYKKGTAPDPNLKMTEKDLIEYKRLFMLNVERLQEDFKAGKYKQFNSYTTSVNISLECIEDAIAFNNMHEGIHLGSILALKKLI